MIGPSLAAAGLYLLCYGGVRGPVDWLGDTVHRGPHDRRRVALTFDDGPHPVHTPALLDVLAAERARATFFVCGAAVDAHPGLCRRIDDAGHELGNHTYAHAYLPWHRGRRVAREVAATDAAIAAATGRVPTVARPPYGGRSPWTLRAFAALGKRTVLWDLNPFDWRGGSAGEIAARVVGGVQPGSIVLLHEARPGGDVTVEATRRIVPRLRDRGYELVTVSELLGGAVTGAPRVRRSGSPRGVAA